MTGLQDSILVKLLEDMGIPILIIPESFLKRKDNELEKSLKSKILRTSMSVIPSPS